ncbi:MAG: 4'-phosphopantetheinyl transferase superfamily protein [Rhodobacteraceae bacterium]|nr:4'-phosphopantetheinyl transferase superfamily protein [Paracoccaceae bacterium]
MSPGDDPLTRRRLETLAAVVFPRLRVGVAPVGEVSLKPEERTSMAGARTARQAEFSAGRAAARLALGRDVAIPMGEDRAPVWPAEVAGSISHAGGWALAVVGSGLIGADLEMDEALPDEVRETVLRPEEQDVDGRTARLIFSAKECAYKAQFPVTRALFGFETFAIHLGDGVFRAVWQRDVAPFRAGQALEGRFARAGGFILTGIG